MLQSGVVDYIYKPFDIDELHARIKTIITNVEAQKREGLEKAIEVISREIEAPEKPPADKKAELIQHVKN